MNTACWRASQTLQRVNPLWRCVLGVPLRALALTAALLAAQAVTDWICVPAAGHQTARRAPGGALSAQVVARR